MSGKKTKKNSSKIKSLRLG